MSPQTTSGSNITTSSTEGADEPFTQSDWDYQLDILASTKPSREELDKHLAAADASASPENVAFLRRMLMDMGGAHYTPFED